MHLVREPDLEVALSFLRDAIQGLEAREGHLVQVVARCHIRYQGRARSMLHGGERMLILKPDGTFLVHTASKAKPVNWQPPGAAFHVDIEEGVLVLTAFRAKPEEIVRVEFEHIALLLSLPLEDGESLSLVGSEDDLQELLHRRPELVEPGFVPARRERDGRRGFHDLDGDDAAGNRLVIEVKRSPAGIKEAQQLWRYVDALRHEDGRRVRGVLIAPRVAAKSRTFLKEHGLEWKELDWEDVLPKVEAMRRVGQSGLARFG